MTLFSADTYARALATTTSSEDAVPENVRWYRRPCNVRPSLVVRICRIKALGKGRGTQMADLQQRDEPAPERF
jgi:hypothetical protein